MLEETGITAISLEEIGRYISHDTIYYQFLCITDCGYKVKRRFIRVWDEASKQKRGVFLGGGV